MPKPKEKKAALSPAPAPARILCMMCGERFDEQKDPNHLEACRDARKP